MRLLYMDHNLSQHIIDELVRTGVDCLTAREDGHRLSSDPVIIERAAQLGRVFVTHDRGITRVVNNWYENGKSFPGAFILEQDAGRDMLCCEHVLLILNCAFDYEIDNLVNYFPRQL